MDWKNDLLWRNNNRIRSKKMDLNLLHTVKSDGRNEDNTCNSEIIGFNFRYYYTCKGSFKFFTLKMLLYNFIGKVVFKS